MFLSSARNRPNNAMIAKFIASNSNGVNFNPRLLSALLLRRFVSNSNGVNFNNADLANANGSLKFQTPTE